MQRRVREAFTQEAHGGTHTFGFKSRQGGRCRSVAEWRLLGVVIMTYMLSCIIILHTHKADA